MVILPLTLKDATAHARGKRLLGPVSMTLAAGGITIVIGPNGAGKTTLLRLMHGLQRRSGGTVNWATAEQHARQQQSYVFQSPIMMRRKVLDSLAYPLRLRGMAKAEAHKAAQNCAGRFGLADLLESWSPRLSGGEKQKLALARALITTPEILFLDEPCANLDGRATREIEAILRDVAEAGTKIVMSTHSMGQARRLAEEVLFMHNGTIHEQADAARFFAAPASLEARAFINGDIVE